MSKVGVANANVDHVGGRLTTDAIAFEFAPAGGSEREVAAEMLA